jgi:hypothetical protein
VYYTKSAYVEPKKLTSVSPYLAHEPLQRHLRYIELVQQAETNEGFDDGVDEARLGHKV